MKLSTIIQPEFKQAYVALCAQKLPAVTAYKLAKIDKILEAELVTYNDIRTRTLESYAAKDGDGKPSIVNGKYDILPIDLDKAMQELSVVQEQVITFDRITIPELGSMVTLTTREMNILFDLFI